MITELVQNWKRTVDYISELIVTKFCGMNFRTIRTRMLAVAIVTRLGDFWNFLATNFITKVAQMFGDFEGNCEKHFFFKSNWLGYFWATFGKTWATFYFNIRSHWRWRAPQLIRGSSFNRDCCFKSSALYGSNVIVNSIYKRPSKTFCCSVVRL